MDDLFSTSHREHNNILQQVSEFPIPFLIIFFIEINGLEFGSLNKEGVLLSGVQLTKEHSNKPGIEIKGLEALTRKRYY